MSGLSGCTVNELVQIKIKDISFLFMIVPIFFECMQYQGTKSINLGCLLDKLCDGVAMLFEYFWMVFKVLVTIQC